MSTRAKKTHRQPSKRSTPRRPDAGGQVTGRSDPDIVRAYMRILIDTDDEVLQRAADLCGLRDALRQALCELNNFYLNRMSADQEVAWYQHLPRIVGGESRREQTPASTHFEEAARVLSPAAHKSFFTVTSGGGSFTLPLEGALTTMLQDSIQASFDRMSLNDLARVAAMAADVTNKSAASSDAA